MGKLPDKSQQYSTRLCILHAIINQHCFTGVAMRYWDIRARSSIRIYFSWIVILSWHLWIEYMCLVCSTIVATSCTCT